MTASSLPLAARSRLAHMLANGIAHHVAASACGLSASRLSQLLETDEELNEAISVESAKEAARSIGRVESIRKLEDQLVRTLPVLIDECTTLGEGVRALETLTNMRMRSNGMNSHGNSTGVGVGIQLNLSAVAQTQINVVLGDKKCIIELGGQSVQPMPRHLVEDFFNGDVLEQQQPDPEAILACQSEV